MISNPLSEWDLVGSRLIELIDETRRELSALAPPAGLGGNARALADAMAATRAMLEAIESHGSRTDQAEAFQRALDDWVDHVLPRAEAIRDMLGLPAVPPGDMQL
jgi:threonine dehydratase